MKRKLVILKQFGEDLVVDLLKEPQNGVEIVIFKNQVDTKGNTIAMPFDDKNARLGIYKNSTNYDGYSIAVVVYPESPLSKMLVKTEKSLVDSLLSEMPLDDKNTTNYIAGCRHKYDLVSDEKEKPYDEKGNASHYSDQRINVIWQLEQIWGSNSVVLFCEMNAFKYRSRMGKKDDPSRELTKIDWYEKAAKFFLNREKAGKDLDVRRLVKHDFKIE